jgi:hypothetical protein
MPSKPVQLAVTSFYDHTRRVAEDVIYVLTDDGRIFLRWQQTDANPDEWQEIEGPWLKPAPSPKPPQPPR